MAAAPKLKLGDIVEGHTYMGGDPNNQQNWVNMDDLMKSGKSGDDFLGAIQKSNPAVANQVKMLSEGRLAVPQSRAATDPYWQTMMQLGALYDPSLDQTDYPKRQSTAKDFASGASAQNIRNLNQAIGHLQGLTKDYGNVAGHQGLLGLGRAWNSVSNTFADWNGDPGITDYEAHRKALAGELASVFKGKGTSAEAEVNKWYDQLNPNLSTAQKQANARSIVDMLNSRLEELSQQYNQGMGTNKQGFEFLNPDSRKAFESLQVLGLDPDKAAMIRNEAGPVASTPPKMKSGMRQVGRFMVEGQ